MTNKIKTFLTKENIWKSFVAIAVMIPFVCVYVLETILMFFRHLPVSKGLHSTFMTIAFLLAFALITLACILLEGEDTLTDKTAWLYKSNLVAKRIVLLLLLDYGLVAVITFEFVLVAVSRIAYFIVVILAIIAEVIICLFMGSWKNILLLISLGLALGIPSLNIHLYVVNVILRIVVATAMACLVVSLIDKKDAQTQIVEETEEVVNSEPAPDKKPKYIFGIVLVAGIVIFQLIVPLVAPKRMTVLMNDAVDRGRKFAALDQVTEAVNEYKTARNYRDVLVAYLDENSNVIEAKYREMPEDDYVAGICYVGRDDFSQLESDYLLGNFDMNKAYILLDGYAKKEELSDEEKTYRSAVTRECINNSWLVDENRFIGIKYVDTKNIEKRTAKLEESLYYVSVLENMQLAYEYGEPSYEVAKLAVEAANNNPEDLVYQLAAVLYYDQIDGLENGICNAASRYYYLVKDVAEKENDDESQLVAAKLATTACRFNNNYDKAIEICEDCRQKITDDELNILTLQAYTGGGNVNFEKIAELAAEFLEDDPDNVVIRFYAAINSWNAGDLETSIKHTLKLSEDVVDASDDEKEKIFSSINEIVTRMTYSATSGSRYYYMYDHRVIELDENCQKLIDSNKLLKNYRAALVNIYTGGDMEEALAELDEVEKIVPNMSRIYLQKGNALYQLGRYDEALKQYQAYIDIVEYDIAVRKAMAECYMALGDNDSAIEKCKEIIDINNLQESYSALYEVDKWAVECLNDLTNGEGDE